MRLRNGIALQGDTPSICATVFGLQADRCAAAALQAVGNAAARQGTPRGSPLEGRPAKMLSYYCASPKYTHCYKYPCRSRRAAAVRSCPAVTRAVESHATGRFFALDSRRPLQPVRLRTLTHTQTFQLCIPLLTDRPCRSVAGDGAARLPQPVFITVI
jgi:hypothetical protein